MPFAEANQRVYRQPRRRKFLEVRGRHRAAAPQRSAVQRQRAEKPKRAVAWKPGLEAGLPGRDAKAGAPHNAWPGFEEKQSARLSGEATELRPSRRGESRQRRERALDWVTAEREN